VCRDRDCRESCGNPSIGGLVWQTDANNQYNRIGRSDFGGTESIRIANRRALETHVATVGVIGSSGESISNTRPCVYLNVAVGGPAVNGYRRLETARVFLSRS